MKQITQPQMDAILKIMMNLNVPVQIYVGIEKLFNELPEVKEKKKDI